jgi:HK97 family phage prohead protease
VQTMKIEQKLLLTESIELKFDAEQGTFEGYASVFNGVDSYGDSIAPGAYKKTLRKRDRAVKMRWNHYGPVIGKWTEMREDDKGLYVKGELTPNHSVASDVLASLKHGAIDGLSIGFYPSKYKEDEDGKRTLQEIDLVEISVVEEPADLNARITNVKAAIEDATSLKEIEEVLKDSGLSKAAATTLISRVKSLSQRDAEPEPLAVIAGLIEQANHSIKLRGSNHD